MKKALYLILEVINVCLNILMAALCFIKLDHDVAFLPNESGGVVKADYYYSIYDKLLEKNLQFLVYIALAVMAVAIVLSVVTCVSKGNRKISIASHVASAVSVLFFLVLLFYAMRILQYAY